MLKKSIFITIALIFIIITSFIGSSIYTLYSKKEISVDPKLKEISGIEFDKHKRLWAINDSGDDPKLYRLNKDGSIAKEILVTNAKILTGKT